MSNYQHSLSIINDAQYKNLNTFNIQGQTKYLVNVASEEHLISAIDFTKIEKIPYIILGGGSNVLMTKDIDGLIIHMAIKGIKKVDETNDHVFLKIGAGVNWHEFVQYCLKNNYYGIENLSLIPGTVGAAPIQNIGAYGVELKEVFHQLQAINIATQKMVTFDHAACEFSYRDSIFKKIKDTYVISHVILRLNKKPHVVLTDNSVKNELVHLNIKNPKPNELSEIICNIRRRKLPYDRNIGNAGSFFMNPYIAELHFNKIKAEFNDAIGFPNGAGLVKMAAGWMIDKCGWRGYREGDAGVYEHNALVLVNHGLATGRDILNLAERIKTSVNDRFGVMLHIEPRVY